jgi:hypothetical protein
MQDCFVTTFESVILDMMHDLVLVGKADVMLCMFCCLPVGLMVLSVPYVGGTNVMCAGVPTSEAGGNVDPGTCRGAMTSLLQLDNLQDCISGATGDQITKLFPKCRPRDINLNPLQQQTAQQDGQHDHDNNSLLRHRLSVVSVVMDAPPATDRCVQLSRHFL